MAWIQGRWKGAYKSMSIEEIWSEPEADTMAGLFRGTKDGAVAFYEFIAIEREGDGLVLRIKHFNAGLKGWEERDECVEFDLASLDGQRAVWCKRGEPGKWLLYERIGDRMQAWFEREGEPSPDSGSRFSFQRM